jgi:hypothetical protein
MFIIADQLVFRKGITTDGDKPPSTVIYPNDYFPGSDRHCLDIINYKCKDISDEQFRLLIEIINRYIEAVTLK